MKTKLALTSLLICACAVPLANAQQPPGSHGAFGLLRHDANQDGQLTFDELNTSIRGQFASIDVNGDSTITTEERKAHREAQQATRMNAYFANLDTNGDGALSPTEFTNRAERADRVANAGPRQASRRPGFVPGGGRGRQGPDPEADISYTDFSARLLERFDAVDKDGNRVITQAELHAAADAPRKGRR